MKFSLFSFESGQKKALSSVSGGSGLWRRIIEPFAGAWQRNMEEDHGTLVTYPTLYACIMRIASDIGKLPFTLKREDDNGIWKKTTSAAYDPVLRKPNHYQTAQQFRESWLLSKLIHGNTYALKRRDARGVVIALYILDPCRVCPMVSDSGQVFYRLYHDNLNSLRDGTSDQSLVVPASEIIHDRCVTLHHWLIGVPPLAAAYWPAVKNMKILKSATEFFGNSAQPGGILTAPAGMNETDAKAVRDYWQENYTGDNAGKIAVIGADMKFTSFAMKGVDSQLVEQMRYSDEQICQPFGIPPFIVGIGSIPAGLKVDDVMNVYYASALQTHIEAIEALFDEGLRIDLPLGVELDLEPLLRMDPTKQAEVVTKLIGGKTMTPNEGRARFSLGPVAGGNDIYGQHQDYSLDMLSRREEWDATLLANQSSADTSTSSITDDEPDDEQARAFVARIGLVMDEELKAMVVQKTPMDLIQELASAH